MKTHSQTPKITARQVADYILMCRKEQKKPVSNLELQKLVYYAQAWHTAALDRPLFNERIEAWVHGPVQPALYGQFKKYRWDIIDVVNEKIKKPSLPSDSKSIIDAVLVVYKDFSAWQLEQKTHEEEPWKQARGKLKPDEDGHGIISVESMKAFYGKQIRDKKI